MLACACLVCDVGGLVGGVGESEGAKAVCGLWAMIWRRQGQVKLPLTLSFVHVPPPPDPRKHSHCPVLHPPTQVAVQNPSHVAPLVVGLLGPGPTAGIRSCPNFFFAGLPDGGPPQRARHVRVEPQAGAGGRNPGPGRLYHRRFRGGREAGGAARVPRPVLVDGGRRQRHDPPELHQAAQPGPGGRLDWEARAQPVLGACVPGRAPRAARPLQRGPLRLHVRVDPFACLDVHMCL